MSSFSKPLESSSSSLGCKCKEFKPQAILIDLRTIIKSDSLDQEYFIPYIKEHLEEYLKENWQQPCIVEAVESLRNNSFTMRFRKDRDDCPLVESEDIVSLESVISSLVKFMKWQIEHRSESPKALYLHRHVLLDGLDRGQIKIPVFRDVKRAIKKWRDEQKLRIYVHGFLTHEFMEKILTHTEAGNVLKMIDAVLDSSLGRQEQTETYLNVSKKLNISFSEVLVITVCGKAGKAANMCGGSVILVQRSSMRLREYYQTKFPVVESFNDIAFIDRVISVESLRNNRLSLVVSSEKDPESKRQPGRNDNITKEE